jgi:hypothetical protein
VRAVLSNGPTPSADPVGYAEAQILPLKAIHTSDAALHAVIDRLSAAYQQVYFTEDSPAAKAALRAAGARMDAVCPGAVGS